MRIKLKKTYFTMAMLVFTIIVSAQELPFSQVEANNFTMRGDVTMIGNSSVSLNGYIEQDRFGKSVETQFGPNDDFNIPLNNANLVMDYINIDEDDTTISSSSADLILPSDCSKIKYAGLYWAGTYFWKQQLYWDTDALSNDLLTLEDTGRPAYLESDGTIVQTETEKLAYSPDRNYGENDPSITNPRTNNDEHDFRNIKFKPPGQAYIDITPTSAPVVSEVLFDGFPRTGTNPGNNAVTDVPYVGYADVTSIVAGLADPMGTYMVADVKAFTGRTNSGGTAAGWTLVVTYEDPNEPSRLISSFEGYARINAGAIAPVTYSYNGFQTPPTGPVKARFGIAALEGDEGFVGDALSIKADSKSDFTILGTTPLSPPNNFFDSSISNNGNNVTTRNPKSLNTLGFDLDMLDIENPNNSIIGNNETGLSFRTSTASDAFGTFLNVFSVESMEPDLTIILTVEDKDGFPLQQGSGVVLGQELFYVLIVENIGNDAATETTILNDIPINVIELNSITLPEGVVANFDPMLRRYTFTIPDNLVEVGADAFEIRFKLQVAQSCELTDACSDDIKNVASISYEGVIGNAVVNNDPVVSELANCNSRVVSTTNFLVDFGTCTTQFEEMLCNGEASLTAGNNYEVYLWTNSSGEEIGDTQSILVNQAGVYTLEAIGGDCRAIIETYTVSPLTTNGQNPVLPFADSFSFCAIDGSIMPEIYLCGESDERLIDATGFLNATSLAWEKLDETSCPVVSEPGCPNADNTCTWNTVGTTPTFAASDPGRYRISAVFVNTCTEYFYFDVFKNTLGPTLTKRDIFCGESGFVQVSNVPATGYEFATNITGPYKTLDAFNANTSVTTQGEVTVYIRQVQTGSLPVVCTFEEKITVFEIDENCPTLGTPDLVEKTAFMIYPNPTTGKVNITTTVDEVKLYNVSGKMVYQTKTSIFDISTLPDGMYFAEITKDAVKEIKNILLKK